ncbi:MAG: hypothetical protein N3A66_00370 [Planctomycetota bacterium]|nr:hypothetical protein [Planctomycetota bacterium]
MKRSGLSLLLALAMAAARALGGEEAPAPPPPPTAGSTSGTTAAIESQKSLFEYGLLGIGVALIVAGGALATGIAQSRIGTAVAAACAEDRKNLVVGILLLAFPETILILSIGIAYLLMKKIS